MILYDKILSIYSLSELREMIGASCTSRVKNNLQNVSLDKISRAIPFEKIVYSHEDFLEDFGDKYNGHIEKEMLYNTFKKGKAPGGLIREFDLDSTIYHYYKTGFNYHGKAKNIHLVFHILGIEVDVTSFEVDIFKSHIELFGEKNLLESFKDKYSLPQEILWEPYREKWHLAFDGCLAKYIANKKTGV